MKAMILAAGRGERLRPLTDHTPKPLLKVGNRRLIEHHLVALAQAGFTEVVINLGWLGERIREALGNGQRYGLEIRYSPEPPGALETAGGIVHALPLLGQQPFAAIAADILCDFDYATLPAPASPALATLVMVNNPPHHPQGDFALDDGLLRLDGHNRLTFSGIAVYHPALFAGLTPGRRALRPVFESAIAAGQLAGLHHTGGWSDIGTPERLAEAQHSPMVRR
ncbi:MAG: N-acetylmuramate alpha-1-phosphate uridylyltransferase MurU [Wenzhouxiangella sp.]